MLLRHADVKAAALDDIRFSSKVSRYLQIPNGLDGAEHDGYRALIDKYLTPAALNPFVPRFEQIAAQLVSELPRDAVTDAVGDIGAVFAVRAQCAWLGWPEALEPRLLGWIVANQQATRSGRQDRTAAVAEEFDDIIRSLIRPRRDKAAVATDDLTADLCRETLDGRPLTEEELVSILRNWTGGDLGSMALCAGVIIARLADEPELAEHLRRATEVETDATLDEILRLDDPFVSNRRVTTCPVRIGGADIPEGARVILNWTSANRDEAAFDTSRFDPFGHAAQNLVYGIGRHVCPGRLLATMQLRILVKALVKAFRSFETVPDQPAERALPPVGGFQRVPVRLRQSRS